MTNRFTVRRVEITKTRAEWLVWDGEKQRIQGGNYRLQRQAKDMAARWNADRAIAEAEAPAIAA